MNPDEELLDACNKGDIRRAKRAIAEGAHPNTSSDDFGFTPLMSAARQGDLELVALLLEAGAVAKARSSAGVTALQVADCRGNEVFDALVAAGADIRSASLNSIARAGNIDLLARVLEAGVAVDPPGGNRASALMTAAQHGQVQLASRLVETHGADTNYTYGHQTALSIAINAGDLAMTQLLLDAGADPHRADNQGMTPLHHAARLQRADLAGLLLAAGADPAVRNEDGLTPLDLARSGGPSELIELLDGGAAEPPANDS